MKYKGKHWRFESDDDVASGIVQGVETRNGRVWIVLEPDETCAHRAMPDGKVYFLMSAVTQSEELNRKAPSERPDL